MNKFTRERRLAKRMAEEKERLEANGFKLNSRGDYVRAGFTYTKAMPEKHGFKNNKANKTRKISYEDVLDIYDDKINDVAISSYLRNDLI